MLEDGEEELLSPGALRHGAQHSEHLISVSELHSDVLEAMHHLLKIVLPVVLKDVKVGGEVVKLDLTQVLRGGGGQQ